MEARTQDVTPSVKLRQGWATFVGDAVAALQRQVAISDGPDLRPGTAVEPHEDIVAVVGDMPARAHIILGRGLEQADAKIAEEAHLRRRRETLVLGMPDLGIAELLHPHVSPEAKAILVAQMRRQAVGRKIDLLHWPDGRPQSNPCRTRRAPEAPEAHPTRKSFLFSRGKSSMEPASPRIGLPVPSRDPPSI
ncbi:hypothetical protein [Mesorhizobium sp.]|uniref:hypothetical protein n=1 Tax=Mesorhizobium sp. TaxID=1871066 RepID=UPI0012168C49|nr:hypothetical protein [Mesorhizobium sp.]TIV59833.1 MAG: hypothetical protein E5V80_12260 [Mesorhizobium sp.]